MELSVIVSDGDIVTMSPLGCFVRNGLKKPLDFSFCFTFDWASEQLPEGIGSLENMKPEARADSLM
jgi:hypothetical protein